MNRTFWKEPWLLNVLSAGYWPRLVMCVLHLLALTTGMLGASGCQWSERGHQMASVEAKRRIALLEFIAEGKEPVSIRRAIRELRSQGVYDRQYCVALLPLISKANLHAEDCYELIAAYATAGDAAVPLILRELDGRSLDRASDECLLFTLGRIGPQAQSAAPRLRKMLEEERDTSELGPALRVALANIAPDRTEHAAWVGKAVKAGGKTAALCYRAMVLADGREWIDEDMIAEAARKVGDPNSLGDMEWAALFLGLQGEKATRARESLVVVSKGPGKIPAMVSALALTRIDAGDRENAVRRFAKLTDPGSMITDHTSGAGIGFIGMATLILVDRPVIEQLAKALDDRDDAAVRGAARALGTVGLPASEAWDKLAAVVLSDRDESVRIHAASALVNVTTYDSLKKLKELCGRVSQAPGEVMQAGIDMIELRGDFPTVSVATQKAVMRSFMVGLRKWDKVADVMRGGSNQEVMSLVKGFNLSSRDDNGSTLLHYAAEYGREPAVAFILEQGADPDIRNDSNDTPLRIAAGKGHVGVVRLLLDRGAHIGEPKRWMPLLYAAHEGRTEVVKLLLERGSDAKAKGESGQSLLHEAAHSGVKDLVAFVIASGADVNAQDKYGYTPLHKAASAGSTDNADVVELLLAKGAQVDAAVMGITALHLAAAGARGMKTAKVLLDHGAQPGITNDGQTSLHWAMKFGDADHERLQDCAIAIAKVFLDKGVDINARDKLGRTALDIACEGWHRRLAEFLRERGAKTGREIEAEKEAKDGAAEGGKRGD